MTPRHYLLLGDGVLGVTFTINVYRFRQPLYFDKGFGYIGQVRPFFSSESS